jgi:hypothetical protein
MRWFVWVSLAVLMLGGVVSPRMSASNGHEHGSAAATMRLKPPNFTDKRMVAGMTDAYWFWRVSEGGVTVQPFMARGSVMPAYKDLLSVEERWAVIAYQHTLSGHTGPHIATEHPELRPRHAAVAHEGAAHQVTVLPEVPASRWVTRDHRWQPRGPWNWAIPRELPGLYREFNGIDFGHAHLAETLLRTQDPAQVERARLEILDFIFNAPAVPPDEEQVAPTFARMVWE